MYLCAVTDSPTRPTLRDLRKAIGLTQDELATKAGVTRATVNRLERGRPASIEFETVRQLAAALNASTLVVFASLEASKSTADSAQQD